MAHSASLTYDRLAWASTWYLREETLKAAVTALVNFQYHQPLAQHWGGGTLSSSDGQRFPVQGQVRNARALPRYFGYGQGITFYTWSSDQFSQYGTKVISSTVRDATYVLDEILDNETDLTILEHTTDTAGYTDLVFGLFDLLGMQFSPRLRDIGDRQLYKLKTDTTLYPRLDARLTGRLDLTRLLERWDDLARVAGSLTRGYVTASLLISRLQAYPRQGQLTKVLQEYGRLIKTLFIIRYLHDEALRRRVHAQLNKGEKLHDLRKFLFFAREGMVSQKYEEGQANQAACLNLLTNAVIVWNTVYMQVTLDTLRHEGYPVQEEDLVHLWPTRSAHVHRYGKYEFNVEAARARLGYVPWGSSVMLTRPLTFVHLLERRAKLGPASRGQGPAPEALARHRRPSVAGPKVTTVMKRTQGADGPPCARVKGLSPVMNGELWVPTGFATGKALSEGPTAKAPANPPGSKTGARQQGRTGNSGDPRRSSNAGVGRHNRHTGRMPNGASAVGCPQTSEDAG